MDVDTKAMREMIDASPGTLMAIEKEHLHELLAAVETGQTAVGQLADLKRNLSEIASA